MIANPNRRQLAAIMRAIELMETERRRHADGEHAYRSGIRADVVDSDGVTGTAFAWVEMDHKEYMRIEKDISELYDLLEMLEDTSGTITKQMEMKLS